MPMRTVNAPTPDQLNRTPMRSRVIRCDDPTWDDAMAQARADGVSLAKVLRHMLADYGRPVREAREQPRKRQSRAR